MELEVRLRTMTGQGGVIRWAYTAAAELTSWEMTRTADGWALAAVVASADEYRVSQRPLIFVAANGWRWPILTLQLTGASLTATLGPKETSHGGSLCQAPGDALAAQRRGLD